MDKLQSLAMCYRTTTARLLLFSHRQTFSFELFFFVAGLLNILHIKALGAIREFRIILCASVSVSVFVYLWKSGKFVLIAIQ